MNQDLYFLEQALKEAKKSAAKAEVPVGAIIVKDKKIIARAHNLKESRNDPTAHAELLAIQKAAKKLKSWRLLDCTLYTTLEPCPMCAGTILQARLKRIIYGAKDLKWGAAGTIVNLLNTNKFNHQPEIEHITHQESTNILKDFFKKRRS
jgi:tRNA(adenine34) deaminase